MPPNILPPWLKSHPFSIYKSSTFTINVYVSFVKFHPLLSATLTIHQHFHQSQRWRKTEGRLYTIVFFKRIWSQHIHKEIKLQRGMIRMDMILCKTDLKLIQRLTYNYKRNIFNDVPKTIIKMVQTASLHGTQCFRVGIWQCNPTV